MSDYLITELADSMGYVVEAMLKFFYNLTGGWILILTVLTVGFVLIIYFRFFGDLTAFKFTDNPRRNR